MGSTGAPSCAVGSVIVRFATARCFVAFRRTASVFAKLPRWTRPFQSSASAKLFASSSLPQKGSRSKPSPKNQSCSSMRESAQSRPSWMHTFAWSAVAQGASWADMQKTVRSVSPAVFLARENWFEQLQIPLRSAPPSPTQTREPAKSASSSLCSALPSSITAVNFAASRNQPSRRPRCTSIAPSAHASPSGTSVTARGRSNASPKSVTPTSSRRPSAIFLRMSTPMDCKTVSRRVLPSACTSNIKAPPSIRKICFCFAAEARASSSSSSASASKGAAAASSGGAS
mmetsp:Transcript_6744/g.23840  ORF Transcript_6744/g.23840 Transcript_6744/m.23840 type:complete len:286 (+) Transcript_6744:1141-1998(+)